MQCKNNLKNIGLSTQNFYDTYGYFPLGGTQPQVNIEQYLADTGSQPNPDLRVGPPNGPLRQGMSWMYQILPYLEEGQLKQFVQQEDLAGNIVSLYTCPSRRSPTLSPAANPVSLVDYAAATAGPARSEVADVNYDDYLMELRKQTFPGPGSDRYISESFWGCRSCGAGLPSKNVATGSARVGRFFGWPGVVQRCDWLSNSATAGLPGGGRHEGYTSKITFAKIQDGSSKTLIVAEKLVPVDYYSGRGPEGTLPGDDAGWADGWDCNNLRTAMVPPRGDSDVNFGSRPPRNSGACTEDYDYAFGSAHPAVFNVLFADGSVHSINYDVEQETLNQLAHRSDGEVIVGEY